ncbi:MAG: 5'-3' exonuclease H3TH domain-containing protein [Patescibacteria group bacterium]
MNRLVLIDGNAMMHRAYHALPPLTTPDGTLVNAVYGFTSMLIKLFGDLKPTHMAVAFDRPEPTFRKKLFKDYQAHRPELDDGMVSQFPIVRDVVSAFNIPVYDAAGFEADDVMATLAAQAPMQVIIVTGDRDLLQLVRDNRVLVFMPTKGLSEGALYGERQVEERMGVKPKLIPALKALAGDPSDNYPGVGGIGPKTAANLLKEYGTVEKLLKAAEKSKLPEGVNKKLMGGAESARLGQTLAMIRHDAPVAFSADSARIETLDTLDARAKLAELHFPSLVKRLSGKTEKQEKPKKETPKKPEDLPAGKAGKKEQLSLV